MTPSTLRLILLLAVLLGLTLAVARATAWGDEEDYDDDEGEGEEGDEEGGEMCGISGHNHLPCRGECEVLTHMPRKASFFAKRRLKKFVKSRHNKHPVKSCDTASGRKACKSCPGVAVERGSQACHKKHDKHGHEVLCATPCDFAAKGSKTRVCKAKKGWFAKALECHECEEEHEDPHHRRHDSEDDEGEDQDDDEYDDEEEEDY